MTLSRRRAFQALFTIFAAACLACAALSAARGELFLSARIFMADGALPLLLAGIWLAGLALNVERQAELALASLSAVVCVYLLQAGLLRASRPAVDPRGPAEHYRQAGLTYDPRSRSELLADLSKTDPSVALNFGPAYVVSTDGLPAGGTRIFPLGGMAKRRVITCNENGRTAVVPTDEHGFPNPTGHYLAPQIVLLGDSFAAGACVEGHQSIAAALRRKYPRTLSLGQGATGPLVHRAILAEYARPLKPQVVLWLYFVNDVGDDLPREAGSALLRRYADPAFTQDLMHRRGEIEAAWRSFNAEVLEHPERAAVVAEPDRWPRRRERVAKFAALYYARALLRGRYQLWGADHLQVARFAEVLEDAQARVAAWGGRLYFVYLPERSFFAQSWRSDRFRDAVLQAAASKRIPVIDMLEVFSKHDDPLSLFWLRRSVHYNVEGYRLAADAIAARLARDGVKP